MAAITAAAVTIIGVMVLGGGSSDKPGDPASAATGESHTSSGLSASVPAPDLPGTAAVAGVEVDQPAVDLGRVPLNTAVRHLFRLKNVAEGSVALGRARIEVLEGC